MKLKKVAAIVSCTILGIAISSCSAEKADNDTTSVQNMNTKASTEQQSQSTSTQQVEKNQTTQSEQAKDLVANTTDTDDLKLKMNADASYVVGYQVGSGIAKQNFGLNNDQTIAGFEDAVKSNQPKISESQIRRNMESLKDKMIKKQLEVSDNNKTKSKEFISKVAGLDGVVKVDDGVYYQTIKQGDGKKPNADSQVTISYKGTTPVVAYDADSSKFDDVKDGKLIGPSFDSSDGVTFPLTNLIQCWKDALPQIQKGSTVILYCSPDKAYGTRAPASIGPNQALAFEITLKDFK
ncbi:peptidylprolyl isomerase [Candidatus Francisella endociliophora]|uniref:Peptidyl-prolyl cis-trans isomerase n=1 Tax=Candidatus Francisella endociliophora TaxID=653937 RepID=A0A097EM71_9GAMM|nr:FKBP-type peptidyl-prolyl cis-trans isomerase N-terminal domain-containing protein [Francisella sp. FSC1006]AIT08643.1 peptidylprolyl isomerase [Francisella sp. FSC1006]